MTCFSTFQNWSKVTGHPEQKEKKKKKKICELERKEGRGEGKKGRKGH